MNWNLENLWHGLGLIVASALAVLFCVMVAKEKRVDDYYLSQGRGSGVAVCIYAHWTWHPDELVFCTDDAQKALDVLTKAKATLK